MATYAELDRIASFRDVVALSGVLMQVGGINVKALVEQGQTSRSASEYGIDNRDEEVTATLLTTGLKPIEFETKVVLSGRKMKITDIEPIGERLVTLTLEKQ